MDGYLSTCPETLLRKVEHLYRVHAEIPGHALPKAHFRLPGMRQPVPRVLSRGRKRWTSSCTVTKYGVMQQIPRTEYGDGRTVEEAHVAS
jgi:hypothetical protein